MRACWRCCTRRRAATTMTFLMSDAGMKDIELQHAQCTQMQGTQSKIQQSVQAIGGRAVSCVLMVSVILPTQPSHRTASWQTWQRRRRRPRAYGRLCRMHRQHVTPRRC